VISYSVAQRTREIGIRTALGATPKNILGLVLRNGMVLTAVGLLFGIAGAIGLSQIIASLLFNVGKYDPPTLIAVGLVLALTSLLACIFPATRATKVNPIVALRSE
jgi:putative ABC transport system permease protein